MKDAEALLAGGEAQRERDVRLAGAAVAERDDVLMAQNVRAAGELEDEHLVEARDRGEVEGVEAFDRREARLPDPPLDDTPLAVDEFELREAEEIAGMIDAFARAVAGHLVVFPQERRQLQLLQVMGKQNLRGGARRPGRHRVRRRFAGHAALPGTRAA